MKMLAFKPLEYLRSLKITEETTKRLDTEVEEMIVAVEISGAHTQLDTQIICQEIGVENVDSQLYAKSPRDENDDVVRHQG